MSDEGIGVEIIEKLQSACGNHPQADFFDAGTGGLSVLHFISGREKAVIIDCALMGTAPGTIKRFTPDDVKTVKKLAHLSLHEADIIKIIELAKELDQCPEEVVFFGIEPVKIAHGIGLSDIILNQMDNYVRLISAEIT